MKNYVFILTFSQSVLQQLCFEQVIIDVNISLALLYNSQDCSNDHIMIWENGVETNCDPGPQNQS